MSSSGSSKRSPFLYFGLVLALSIPFYFVVKRSLFPPNIYVFPVSTLMVWVPFFVALGLTYRESGWNGMKGLAKRAFDFNRIKPRSWLLPIFLLMPIALPLAYVLSNLMGKGLPPPTPLWSSPFFYFSLFAFLLFPFAIAEEIGWSGYATDPLQERFGALGAAVIIGIVWAGWHIVPYIELGRNTEWIVWQCLFTVLFRIVIVSFYNNTRGSVFAAEILHSTYNISYRFYPHNASLYDPRAIAIIVGLLVLLILVLWGPKTLSRHSLSGGPIAAAAGLT